MATHEIGDSVIVPVGRDRVPGVVAGHHETVHGDPLLRIRRDGEDACHLYQPNIVEPDPATAAQARGVLFDPEAST